MKLRLLLQARSGTYEADFRTAVTKKGSRGGVGLRQYRVARWFLLPEVELRRGWVRAADCKSAETDGSQITNLAE